MSQLQGQLTAKREGSPTCEYPLKPTPKFGPDGTWNTPWCKDIDGCEENEMFCPDGCNGVATWTSWSYARNYLRPDKKQFQSCWQGKNYGGVPGTWYNKKQGLMNCFGSENATKPSFFPQPPTEQLTKWKYQLKPWGHLEGLRAEGNEYCPKDCVDDCAGFKLGNFLGCGFNRTAATWAGYDGKGTNNGPNQ